MILSEYVYWEVPLGVPNCSPVFAVNSLCGRVKFPTGLETTCWSTSQLSLVCERATASNVNSSRLFLEWITCAPSYWLLKQMIVNLGEEYLPSKFFACLRLVRTFIIYLSIKWLFWPEIFDRSWAVLGRNAFYKTINMHINARKVKRWPELRFCLDGRLWFGLDWTRLGRSVLLRDFKCWAEL